MRTAPSLSSTNLRDEPVGLTTGDFTDHDRRSLHQVPTRRAKILPADEVAEIVEDPTEHLDQVATELGPHDISTGDLEARLGSPGAYAAELRAAAGYPAMTRTPGLMRMRLRRTLRFVVTWILRAAAVAGAIGVASAVLADWYWGSALIGYAALTAAWH